MSYQPIILPLRNKIKSGKYGVIYIPSKYQTLFPSYKEDFILRTDDGEISPWMSSKSKTRPNGCYIDGGGLLDWFRLHNFTVDDSLVIEIIEPKKIYSLSIQREIEYEEVKTFGIFSKTEGGEKVVISKQAERDATLRNIAIKIHGYICKGCGFNFKKFYGVWGQNYIEVHHIHPLGQTRNKKVNTNPENDLTVLCSNCHKMIHHKRGITLTIDELKEKIIR